MIITRSFRLLTFSLVCVAALPAASALGATTKSSGPARPTVTSVAPLNLGVGDMLTIRGKNFIVGKKRNSVAFKRDGKPAVFVKAAESTRTRMKVLVPAGVSKYLAKKDGVSQPTQFRIRVLARRFSKRYTVNRLSPKIGPANADRAAGPGSPGNPVGAPAAPPVVPPDCDGDGVLDSIDGDDDNDILTDGFEVSIGTNLCSKDSDGDGNEDAWEVYSAIDLNSAALPYPAARPYPNALFADAGRDFDGDGLTGSEEHALWQKFGARALPLNYSDGTQFTGPFVPAPVDPLLVHLNFQHFDDGAIDTAYLDDGEKDADGDRLGNFDETGGRVDHGFWRENTKPEKQFTHAFTEPDFLNPDTDGDGLIDGLDDQDFDDWSNISELTRGPYWVHPLNPCLPDYTSRTCPRYIEAGETVYAPFPLPFPPPATPLTWP